MKSTSVARGLDGEVREGSGGGRSPSGAEAHALGGGVQEHRGGQDQGGHHSPRQDGGPTPAPEFDGDAKQRGQHGPANAERGADDGHGHRPTLHEPAVDHGHDGVHEAEVVAQGDDADIGHEQLGVVVDPGEDQVAHSHQESSRHHHAARTPSVDQVAGHGANHGAQGTGQGEDQRGGAAAGG